MHPRGPDNRRSWITAALGALLACWIAVGPAAPQQTVQRLLHCVLKADKIALDFKTDIFIATGNCTLEYKGEHEATMTAEKMTFRLDEKGQQIAELTTTGITHIDLKTAPPNPRHIVGRCNGGASFSETTQLITMTGGADVTVEDVGTAQPRRYHASGDTFSANLKDENMEVKGNANVSLVQPEEQSKKETSKPKGQ